MLPNTIYYYLVVRVWIYTHVNTGEEGTNGSGNKIYRTSLIEHLIQLCFMLAFAPDPIKISTIPGLCLVSSLDDI